MDIKLSSYIKWNWVCIILFTVGMGIFLIITPKYIDDYWYSYDLKDWFSKQGIWNINDGGNVVRYGIPWDDIKETISYHLQIDTRRLCNVVAPFMLLFPKWVCSIFSLAALLYSIWACLKISRVKPSDSWLVTFCIGLWTLTILWYEPLGSVVYQYNYLLSTGFGLMLILQLINNQEGTARIIRVCLLSVLTGLWHEGFCVPILLSLLTVFIFFRSFRNKYAILAILILTACVVWHFSGGGTVRRLSMGWIGISPRRFLLKFYYHKAMWIALVFTILYIYRFGFRKFFTDRLIVLFLSGIIGSFGITYFTDLDRASWWGDVMAIIMSLYILKDLDIYYDTYLSWRLYVSAIILLISFVEIGFLDAYTIMLAKEYPENIKLYLKYPNRTQFTKLLDSPWNKFLFLQMRPQYQFSYSIYVKEYYFSRKSEASLMNIVPESLRLTREEECLQLEGDLDLKKNGKHLIVRTDSIYPYTVKDITIDYGWFVAPNREMEFIPFISESDGKRYAYVKPVNHFTEFAIGCIKGANSLSGKYH